MNCYHFLSYAIPTQKKLKQQTTSAETSAGTYAVSVSDLKNDQVVQCLVSRRGALVLCARGGAQLAKGSQPTTAG